MSGLNNYQKYLIEAAYKNLKDKPNTSNLTSWYEESGELKHRVDLSSIWVDADSIPLIAPPTNEDYCINVNNEPLSILKYYSDIKLTKIQGTKASFYNENLIDSIDSSFGNGYTVILKDSSKAPIPFGLNKWVIDTESGVLTFIEGIPEGYTLPIYLSFYKYIGRKGNTTLLKSDGTVVMDDNYVPTKDKSLVTKDYVDASKLDVADIIKKLIPNTPPTFKELDLELITPNRKGLLVISTDPAIDVIYRDKTETIVFTTPISWNQNGIGYISILVNNNEVYTVEMGNLFNGDYDKNIIKNITIQESYPDKLVADDFYKSYTLTISLNIPLQVMPFVNNPKKPIVNLKVKWFNGDENYCTNDLIVGLDLSSDYGDIKAPYFKDASVANKYISGVPALVDNDKFSISNTINTLKYFRKDIHGSFDLNNVLTYDIETLPLYKDVSPIIEHNKSIIIPKGIYFEKAEMDITSLNLDNEENNKVHISYPIRVDSKSSEINRVTSPNEKGEGYGDYWSEDKSKQDLNNSNELQMLGGLYQWPRGDYTNNGKNLNLTIDINPGPNYNSITKGIRYVTLSYDLKNSSGFYVTLENAEGFDIDKDNFVIKNIESLKCTISGKNEWLDMNQPYDGVLNPFDLENKGCLVVDKSNELTRYCTFGTEVLSGTLLICLGIPYNLDIKLSGFTVLGNI